MLPLNWHRSRPRHCHDNDFRVVAGCIPYRLTRGTGNGVSNATIEVLMVTPYRGKGLLFPKGGWEDSETKEEAACRETLEEAGVKGRIEGFLGTWDFCSKRHKKDCSSGGSRKSYMYALFVTEQLDSWPEQEVRQRRWLTVVEAKRLCKRDWMRSALEKFVDIVQFSNGESSQICTVSSFVEETSSQSSKSPSAGSDDEHFVSSFEEFSQDDLTERSSSASLSLDD